MIIEKGLVVDEPWIGRILTGEKLWEMRSTRTHHRGVFALICKGSGQVVGVATLDDVSGPYNNAELLTHQGCHQIEPYLFEQDTFKWRYAWQLGNAMPLTHPVSYRHPAGAVTWVVLAPEIDRAIARQLSSTERQRLGLPREVTAALTGESVPAVTMTSGRPTLPIGVPNGQRSRPKARNKYNTSRGSPITKTQTVNGAVPKARDGTTFSTEFCQRNGVYTVGDKGDERRFANYQEALNYLRQMPTARWRRPNAQGNWGIVSAIEWVSL